MRLGAGAVPQHRPSPRGAPIRDGAHRTAAIGAIASRRQPRHPRLSYTTLTENRACVRPGTYPVTVTAISPDSRRVSLITRPLAGQGGPASSRMAIDVSSGAGPGRALPIDPNEGRIPVSLGLRINRIHLAPAGTPSSPGELLLENLVLGE